MEEVASEADVAAAEVATRDVMTDATIDATTDVTIDVMTATVAIADQDTAAAEVDLIIDYA